MSWCKNSCLNCNAIHETPLHNTIKISYGSYRDVLKYTEEITASKTEIIIKTFRFSYPKINEDLMESARIDALTIGRLSSSENVANVFGYCGATMQQESFINDALSAIMTKNKKGSKYDDATKGFMMNLHLCKSYMLH